jgi:hypothetical protein
MKSKHAKENSTISLLEPSVNSKEEFANQDKTMVSSWQSKESEIECKKLKENFGVNSVQVLNEIISSGIKGFPHSASNSGETMEMLLKSIQDMNALDAIEAKLCAKESSLYALAMQYVHRAESGMFGKDSDMASRIWYEANMNYAIKLMRLHNETVETLNRYRRKGEQKVSVQHQYVQVNEGAKAIVGGNLAMGGGGQT